MPDQNIIPQQKQLSRKRFIPMLVLFVIGIVLIFLKDSTKTTVLIVANILESKYREGLIFLAAGIIGILHFYHVGKKK